MKRSIQTSMSLWAFKRRPWTSMTLQSQNRVAGLALDDSQAKPMETETNIYIYIIFDFVSGDVEGQISNAAEGQLFSIISQMILKTQVKRLRIYTVTEIRLLQMKYQFEFVPKKTTKPPNQPNISSILSLDHLFVPSTDYHWIRTQLVTTHAWSSDHGCVQMVPTASHQCWSFISLASSHGPR